MPKTYRFTEEQREGLYAAEKKNKDKNVHKRLVALIKRTEGKSRETAGQHHTSHHWNMSYDEETELLEQFKLAAESGQIVSASEIKEAAGFGRINKPKYCWCERGTRPSVPCHHIREYRYAYGAVEPLTGENFFLIMPFCNTNCMNVFLKKLYEAYPECKIILECDGAAWHKSEGIIIPENIELFFIPPYTPEMNPIEQIWKEIRKRGFKNESFSSLDKVVDRICDTICSLSHHTIKSIAGRKWVLE